MPLFSSHLPLRRVVAVARCSACGWSSARRRSGTRSRTARAACCRSCGSVAGVQSAQLVLTCSAISNPCADVVLHLGIGDLRVRVDVRRAADALPVGDRAARRAVRDVVVEASRRAAVGVIVAGHDDDRLQHPREVPEARQRLLRRVRRQDACSTAAAAARRPAESRPCSSRPSRAARRRSSRRRRDRRNGSARSRRAPGRTTPGCPGACRRPTSPGRR